MSYNAGYFATAFYSILKDRFSTLSRQVDVASWRVENGGNCTRRRKLAREGIAMNS
jgi:hypothetical protein